MTTISMIGYGIRHGTVARLVAKFESTDRSQSNMTTTKGFNGSDTVSRIVTQHRESNEASGGGDINDDYSSRRIQSRKQSHKKCQRDKDVDVRSHGSTTSTACGADVVLRQCDFDGGHDSYYSRPVFFVEVCTNGISCGPMTTQCKRHLYKRSAGNSNSISDRCLSKHSIGWKECGDGVGNRKEFRNDCSSQELRDRLHLESRRGSCIRRPKCDDVESHGLNAPTAFAMNAARGYDNNVDDSHDSRHNVFSIKIYADGVTYGSSTPRCKCQLSY